MLHQRGGTRSPSHRPRGTIRDRRTRDSANPAAPGRRLSHAGRRRISGGFPPPRRCELRIRQGAPSRSVGAMNAPAIETHDLHMHYGQGRIEVRALDGVDLRIEAGEMVAIMGPSGSGKSTLLHIVGALESPTSGTVAVGGLHYEGLDDKQLTELRRDHIGFVFQFFNLLPSLTAEENVTLPAVIAKRHDRAIRERARALLARR